MQTSIHERDIDLLSRYLAKDDGDYFASCRTFYGSEKGDAWSGTMASLSVAIIVASYRLVMFGDTVLRFPEDGVRHWMPPFLVAMQDIATWWVTRAKRPRHPLEIARPGAFAPGPSFWCVAERRVFGVRVDRDVGSPLHLFQCEWAGLANGIGALVAACRRFDVGVADDLVVRHAYEAVTE